MLVPMYFLIALGVIPTAGMLLINSSSLPRRGGLLMLVWLFLLFISYTASKPAAIRMIILDLLNTSLQPSTARWIMMGFLVAFAIKLPVVPLHSWLPDAHSEAPTAGSLILAGLAVRDRGLCHHPFCAHIISPSVSWEVRGGPCSLSNWIVYGVFLVFAQTDLKRLIAYASKFHMGFVHFGIFAFREMAMQGVKPCKCYCPWHQHRCYSFWRVCWKRDFAYERYAIKWEDYGHPCLQWVE